MSVLNNNTMRFFFFFKYCCLPILPIFSISKIRNEKRKTQSVLLSCFRYTLLNPNAAVVILTKVLALVDLGGIEIITTLVN